MTETTEKLVKLQATKVGTTVHLGNKIKIQGPTDADDEGETVETTPENAAVIVKAKLGKIVK